VNRAPAGQRVLDLTGVIGIVGETAVDGGLERRKKGHKSEARADKKPSPFRKPDSAREVVWRGLIHIGYSMNIPAQVESKVMISTSNKRSGTRPALKK
jgi:hypothetical protein